MGDICLEFIQFIQLTYYVHFLCLPKENEPAAQRRKKGQPFTRRFVAGLLVADCPVLLETTGSLKTRYAQTV
jgi:hypothetical protein